MTRKETLIAWLNDAHAAEKNFAQALQQHAIDTDLHADIQVKLQEHLHQTRKHTELIKGCFERLGGSTSSTKSAVAALMGAVGSAVTITTEDKLVKNMLTDYAFKQFEIGAYTSLIAAAEVAGDEETAAVCRRILGEEQDAAEWFAQQVPVATREHFERAQRA